MIRQRLSIIIAAKKVAIRQKELEDPETGGKIFFEERAAYEWLHGDPDGVCTDYAGDGADKCNDPSDPIFGKEDPQVVSYPTR